MNREHREKEEGERGRKKGKVETYIGNKGFTVCNQCGKHGAHHAGVVCDLVLLGPQEARREVERKAVQRDPIRCCVAHEFQEERPVSRVKRRVRKEYKNQ